MKWNRLARNGMIENFRWTIEGLLLSHCKDFSRFEIFSKDPLSTNGNKEDMITFVFFLLIFIFTSSL